MRQQEANRIVFERVATLERGDRFTQAQLCEALNLPSTPSITQALMGLVYTQGLVVKVTNGAKGFVFIYIVTRHMPHQLGLGSQTGEKSNG